MSDRSTLPQLEPTETSVHRPQTDAIDGLDLLGSPSIAFRHSGWQHRRRRIYRALHDLGRTEGTLARFRNCGSGAWVYTDLQAPDTYCVKADFCRSRWCVPCAKAKARDYANALATMFQGCRCRLITLTLRPANVGLATQLERLTKAWTELRRTKLWRDHVTGGISVIEVKRGKNSGLWHPHIHVVAWGSFIPAGHLSNLWKRITGDSFIVDIRAIPDTHAAVSYATKYVCKPMSQEVEGDPNDLRETIEALHGKRLINTFGAARGISINAKCESVDWQPIAPLGTLIRQARDGDVTARHILEVLQCESDPDTRPHPTQLMFEQLPLPP